MKRFQLIMCTIIFLGIAVQAAAGILIVSDQESIGEKGVTFTSRAFVEKDSMRVETAGKDMNSIIIFRNDKKVFWVINKDDGSYTEMTKEDVRAMKKSMDTAMMRLEEQLKDMPPEQRAMVEKMMKGAMPSKPKAPVFRKTGSGIKVNRWVCDRYEEYEDGEKTTELWTTDWKKLGLAREHFDVMQGMSEFFSEFTEGKTSLFRVGSEEWEKEQGYAGVPVKTVSYSDGKPRYKMELKEVSEQKFDPSLFQLPNGLTKKRSPAMEMGGEPE